MGTYVYIRFVLGSFSSLHPWDPLDFALHVKWTPRMRGANSIISDKIVETLASNRGNFGEKNDLHSSLLPSIQSRGVCCFLLVARTPGQHCKEGMGEGKLYFPPLRWQNVREALQSKLSQPILSPIVGEHDCASIFWRCSLLENQRELTKEQQELTLLYMFVTVFGRCLSFRCPLKTELTVFLFLIQRNLNLMKPL